MLVPSLAIGFAFHKAAFSYGWIMGEQAKLLNLRTYLEGFALRNFVSGKVESAAIEAGVEMRYKTGWFVISTLRPSHEYVPEAFDLGESQVPIGSYDFLQGGLLLSTPDAGTMGVFLETVVGGFYDGTLFSTSLTPRWVVSPHLKFEGTYQYNTADFDARGQHYVAHLGKLKAEYLFNTKVSLAAFLQYSSDEQIFVENVRFRYNPREGNDLYIVFNDILNGNRSRELPHLPFSDNRAVVVKYTYTFRL